MVGSTATLQFNVLALSGTCAHLARRISGVRSRWQRERTGAVRYQQATLPTSKGYTGQRADALTGLDYYNSRYYDPLAGQFTSADTTLAGGLNRYGYVAGNPESRTDPSGHILRAPRDYRPTTALSQPQSAVAYVNQWAAPATWQGFASYVGQTLLGTDTLRQSFHTLFQNPHASAAAKWQAAGAAVLTLGTDALTIGSTLVGEPEVGAEAEEAAQASEAALLAADGAEEAAAAASDAAGEVQAVGDPQAAFSELASMRQDLGMGEAGTPSGGTLAKLEVGDQSFFGINAHGQPVDLTVNPISSTHAETDVFQQASNAGVAGGDGNLYVDRELCGACGRSGAVRSLARQLGLRSLSIYTPAIPDGVLWTLGD